MKKILCVVTSNNVKGTTGIPTGFWLSELTHPMSKFEDAGFETVIASIKGGKPPIDPVSMNFDDPINKKCGTTQIFNANLKIPLSSTMLTPKIMTRYFLQADTV